MTEHETEKTNYESKWISTNKKQLEQTGTTSKRFWRANTEDSSNMPSVPRDWTRRRWVLTEHQNHGPQLAELSNADLVKALGCSGMV